MKNSTILALILITLPSSFTSASSYSIDCSDIEGFFKELEDYNSRVVFASSDIQFANQDKTLISSVYPLLDKIENIEEGMNKKSEGFLQTSSYEAASALALSLATLGDEVVDDKITNLNKDIQNYGEAKSDVDRLELISKIRTNLQDLEEEISRYISDKNAEIQSYSAIISEMAEAMSRCMDQDDIA